jgi:hypothetical protein
MNPAHPPLIWAAQGPCDLASLTHQLVLAVPLAARVVLTGNTQITRRPDLRREFGVSLSTSLYSSSCCVGHVQCCRPAPFQEVLTGTA